MPQENKSNSIEYIHVKFWFVNLDVTILKGKLKGSIWAKIEVVYTNKASLKLQAYVKQNKVSQKEKNKYCICGAFLGAQMVKNLPAMQESQVQSLGQEDPLEKGMAAHSSILAWKNSSNPWTEEPGGLQSMGSQRVRHDQATNTFTFMDSRKMVLMNLFSGKEWRCKYREWTCGYSGGRRE